MSDSSWPEQDFVYKWAEENGVEADRHAMLKLINRMTQPRLELQQIRYQLNKYFEENKME